MGLIMGHNKCAFVPIPTNGLIAHYPFTGGSFNDFAGTNHGTNYGATPVADRFGNPNNAMSFDGNDWVDLSNTISGNTAFSYSLWVFPNSSTLGYCIQTRDILVTASNNRIYCVSFNDRNGNSPKLITNNMRSVDFTSNVNSWAHLALTASSVNDLKLYVNGQWAVNGIVNSAQSMYSVSCFGRLNNDFSSGQQYNGKFDNVRVYNRALTDCEIKALANE